MRKYRIIPVILALIVSLVLSYSFFIIRQTKRADVPLNTLVLFYNDECDDCKQIIPLFDDFIKNKDLNITRINVNSAETHALCDKYDIDELPSLAVFTKALFQKTIKSNIQILYTYNDQGQIILNKNAVIELSTLVKKEQAYFKKVQLTFYLVNVITMIIAIAAIQYNTKHVKTK